jgi:hypothetical protein
MTDINQIAKDLEAGYAQLAKLDDKHTPMTEKLDIARRANMLAEQSELIRLEALCRIADSIDGILEGMLTHND